MERSSVARRPGGPRAGLGRRGRATGCSPVGPYDAQPATGTASRPERSTTGRARSTTAPNAATRSSDASPSSSGSASPSPSSLALKRTAAANAHHGASSAPGRGPPSAAAGRGRTRAGRGGRRPRAPHCCSRDPPRRRQPGPRDCEIGARTSSAPARAANPTMPVPSRRPPTVVSAVPRPCVLPTSEAIPGQHEPGCPRERVTTTAPRRRVPPTPRRRDPGLSRCLCPGEPPTRRRRRPPRAAGRPDRVGSAGSPPVRPSNPPDPSRVPTRCRRTGRTLGTGPTAVVLLVTDLGSVARTTSGRGVVRTIDAPADMGP